MKLLYIGTYQKGNTCYQRGKTLGKIIGEQNLTVINTSIPINQTNSFFRSLGFRYKTGPLINKVNKYISEHSGTNNYDLTWIDKGVFIKPKTIKELKLKTKKIVHYTPDTAFLYNKSRWFLKSIPFYDHFITTKSYELEFYPKDKTLLTTQGFDPELHKPVNSFDEKYREVCFVGLYEKYRGNVIEQLLKSGITVAVAGKNWNEFKYINHPNLEYLGAGLFGDEYTELICSSLFGLGLLSKHFPELHTTRTFEIPACGTVLITEKNDETLSFFGADEALFFNNTKDIIDFIRLYNNNLPTLKQFSENGYKRIISDKRDYKNILESILNLIHLR